MPINPLEKLAIVELYDFAKGGIKVFDPQLIFYPKLVHSEDGFVVPDPDGSIHRSYVRQEMRVAFILKEKPSDDWYLHMENEVLFEGDFLPHFDGFMQEKKYSPQNPKGKCNMRDYDERKFPYILEGSKAFDINCGTIELGHEHSSSDLFITIFSKHPWYEQVRIDLLEYFGKYERA